MGTRAIKKEIFSLLSGNDLEQVLADTDDRRSTLVHFVEKMSPDEVDELRAALSDRTEPPT